MRCATTQWKQAVLTSLRSAAGESHISARLRRRHCDYHSALTLLLPVNCCHTRYTAKSTAERRHSHQQQSALHRALLYSVPHAAMPAGSTSSTLTTTEPISSVLPKVTASPTRANATSTASPSSHIDIIAPGAVITDATASKQHRIAILDAGAQYGKVIDRRIRELCVQSDLLPLATPPNLLADYSALIISGGPQSVYGPDAPSFDKGIFELNKPILGICYGMQLINCVYGGKVARKAVREDGQFHLNIDTSSLLYTALPPTIDVLLTHGDSVVDIAPEFTVTATTSAGLVCSVESVEKRVYGVQFHPEVDLTTHGKDILLNFITAIAHIPRTFTLTDRLATITGEIRQEVGTEKKVLMLLSGGVDSSVCAALIKHAIGAERIVAIHIDNGFMRLDESKKVALALQSIGLPLTVIDAANTFYTATTTVKGQPTLPLSRTLNPEHKRKIIGDTFMHVSNAHIASLQLDPSTTLLAQGTLRPDLIESASHLASSNADVIKTHHNDTELVRQLRAVGRIIEPLKDYHKDEVRQLGVELGLPVGLVWRQPFPGPGLAIRILCAEEEYRGPEWDVVMAGLKRFGRWNGSGESEVSVSLLPCRTVGVQGDQRSYSSLVCLSSPASSPPPWSELFALAKEIPKCVHGVNRVVYAYGERVDEQWVAGVTPTYLTPDVISQLQRCDDIVNEVLLQYELIKPLSQVPVILFPANFGTAGMRSVCIRTFITNDFMTGVPAWPGRTIPAEAVELMVERILRQVKGIVRVCFDLTSKPPATTEWE